MVFALATRAARRPAAAAAAAAAAATSLGLYTASRVPAAHAESGASSGAWAWAGGAPSAAAPSLPGLSTYGTLADGSVVQAVTLRQGAMEVKILTLGASVAEIHVPDSAGAVADVVLGFDSLAGWAAPSNPGMNMCIGRLSGRTAAPGFSLDGETFSLGGCDGGGGGIKGETNLHGGPAGFATRNWTVREATETSVTLSLLSPDGDQGFPGAVEVTLTYSLSEDSELWLRYSATTTRPTPISLTNHAYFNLAGCTSGAVHGHTLQLNCSGFNPDDGSGDGVPTGEYTPVKGTVRDFAAPTSVAAVIEGQASDTPLWPHGEQFVVDAMQGRDPNEVAAAGEASLYYLPMVGTLAEPKSGRTLSIFSSEPIVQTYYSTLLAGTELGKGGAQYEKYGAICLESHRPANAENVTTDGYGDRVVRPGTPYKQTTVWKFSTLQ
jgi:aldose 1-epimerase